MKIKMVSQHKSPHRKLILSLLSLVAAGLILAILEVTNVTHFFHQKINYGSGLIPTQSSTGSSKLVPSVTTDNGPSSASAKNSAVPPGSSNSGPIAPWGTFVSNHNPDLGGSPYPSQEESVCNTTPGATCYITFSNGSVTKSLTVQTVNNRGAAFWTWDIKSAGFTTGNWQIKAVASLNGNTATATDSINLRVGP